MFDHGDVPVLAPEPPPVTQPFDAGRGDARSHDACVNAQQVDAALLDTHLDGLPLGVQPLDVTGLERVVPGPELAAALAGVDLGALNGHGRVIVMCAWERLSSWASAGMYGAMAHVARSPECLPDSNPQLTQHYTEFASAEIGAALTLTPGCADRELSLAYHLTERLPGTQAALLAGGISLGKAKEIADETSVLSDDLARQAEQFILAHASESTRQQIVRRLRAKVIRLDPDGAEQRRKEAQRDRKVRFGPDGTGTATISGTSLPIAQVAAAKSFVKTLAKAIHDAGDERTLGQVEADVMLDLLQGHHLDTHGITPTVELVAPLDTWLHLAQHFGLTDNSNATAEPNTTAEPDAVENSAAEGSDVTDDPCGADDLDRILGVLGGDGRAPGELVGFGPICRELLAEIAAMATAGFDYCTTVTGDGQVVFHQRSRYRPTRRQRDLVHARDRTCRHPGCTRPATRSDLDHTTSHRQGGPTCPCNLITLCRRHHRAKHHGNWWWNTHTVQSPLGHTYSAPPQPSLPDSPLPTDAPNAMVPTNGTAKAGLTHHHDAPF
jgi:Domain of unknown function (DUF222)